MKTSKKSAVISILLTLAVFVCAFTIMLGAWSPNANKAIASGESGVDVSIKVNNYYIGLNNVDVNFTVEPAGSVVTYSGSGIYTSLE